MKKRMVFPEKREKETEVILEFCEAKEKQETKLILEEVREILKKELERQTEKRLWRKGGFGL